LNNEQTTQRQAINNKKYVDDLRLSPATKEKLINPTDADESEAQSPSRIYGNKKKHDPFKE
jgi:hypothetical protein